MVVIILADLENLLLAIVVVLLGIGVATFFVGLIFVLPVLGHATWHLYRQAVASSTDPY